MIPGGYNTNPKIKDPLRCPGSHPPPAGSILAIAYNEVNIVFST